MLSRWGRILPLLMLVLAACTRQADGNFQPVSGDEPTSVAVVPTAADEFIITEEAGSAPEDSTEVLTEEAVIPFDTESPIEGSTDAGPIIFTLEPSQTPTESLIVLETETPEETPEFITPGVSSGLMDAGAGGTEEAGLAETPTATEVSTVEDTDSEEDNLEGVDENCIYTVQRGDTLFRIALAQKTTIPELRRVNQSVANNDTIYPGDKLVIPNCNEDDTTTSPTQPSPTTAAPAGSVSHTVRSGESLYIIAQRYGVTIQAIVDANELTDPNKLSVGQVLIIPQ